MGRLAKSWSWFYCDRSEVNYIFYAWAPVELVWATQYHLQSNLPGFQGRRYCMWVALHPRYTFKTMRCLILLDRHSLEVHRWLLSQMLVRKFHLKVLLIIIQMKRFYDGVSSLSPTKLTDISLLLPFVILWKGINCITCKWRDLIFAHYLFIRENEQNISGSPMREEGWLWGEIDSADRRDGEEDGEEKRGVWQQ